jgi:hypothetical protein
MSQRAKSHQLEIPLKDKSEKMTKHDLEKLLQLDRNEAKALKNATDARRVQVIAKGEADLARRYRFDHKPEWAEAFGEAQEIISKLNEKIRADLKEAGIPVEFAPSAGVGWSERGENAVAQRRAELRKVLVTEALAQQKAACVAIDLYSVKCQRELLACGLESQMAKQILASRPTLETLMPALNLEDLEKKIDANESAQNDRDKLPYSKRYNLE